MADDVPPVLWRRGSFVGLFADPYVKDSELEGGWLAPSISDYTQALLRLCGRRSDLFAETLSPTKRADLTLLSSRLLDAAALSVEKTLAKHAPQDFVLDFMTKFASTVRALATGDFCIRPGGWRRRSGGHVILFVIKRQSVDLFSLTVCNTGGGTQYHPSSAAAYPKGGRVHAALHIPDVPLERLISPAFLYMLAKLELIRKEENTAESLYEVLLPFLSGGSLRDATRDASRHGRLESLQRAGTCFFRCILTASRYCLVQAFGWSSASVKRLSVGVRLAYLDAVTDHLRRLISQVQPPAQASVGVADSGSPASAGRHIGGSWDDAVALPVALSESDVLVIRLAVRQTLAAVSKLADAGAVGAAFLDVVESSILDVMGYLRCAADAAGLSVMMPRSILGVNGSSDEKSAARARIRGVLGGALRHARSAMQIRISDDTRDQNAALQALAVATAADTSTATMVDDVPAEVQAPACGDIRGETLKRCLRWSPLDIIADDRSSVYCGELQQRALPSSDADNEVAFALAVAGFDLVAKLALDAEPFAGGASEGEAGGFVDLVEAPATRRGAGVAEADSMSPPQDAWSFVRITGLLRKCLSRCEGLRARAESSTTSACDNASGLVVALIEELVHSTLPFPSSADNRPSHSFSWFPAPQDSPFTADAQRSIVRILFQLALQYSAAIRSLPTSRAAYAARVLTIAAFVVLLDATVRLTTVVLSDPSALATVLCGGQVTSDASDTSPVAYGLTLLSNAVMPFEDLTAVLLTSRPTLLDTRERVLRYCASLNRGRPLLPLTFVPLGAALGGSASLEDTPDVMELPEEDATFQLVQDLCEATGCHNELPRGDERTARRVRSRRGGAEDVPDLERRAAWLADDWPSVPEFALYRDMMLLFRLTAEPAAVPSQSAGAAGGSSSQSWTAALAAPRVRFMHLDFSKKNVSTRTKGPGVSRRYPVSVAAPSAFVVKRTPGPRAHIARATHPSGGATSAPATTAPPAERNEKSDDVKTVPSAVETAKGTSGFVIPPPFLDSEVAEEDVLLATDSQLDTFADTLSIADAEQLLSLLTAPFLRCPLVLSFFARGRAGALFNRRLCALLESILFEPQSCGPLESEQHPLSELRTGLTADSWLGALVPDGDRLVVPVLPEHRRRLGSPRGVLLAELCSSPDAVLVPLLSLARDAATLCLGADCRSAFVPLVLFIVRIVSRVESFVAAAAACVAGGTGQLSTVSASLERSQRDLRVVTTQIIVPLLDAWAFDADARGMIEQAVAVHAHRVLAFGSAPIDELTGSGTRDGAALESGAGKLLSSMCYFVSWFSPAALSPNGVESPDLVDLHTSTSLPLPLHDVYAAFHQQRSAVLVWADALGSSRHGVLHALVSTSLRRPTLSTTRPWIAVRDALPECVRILETPHPYPCSADVYWRVSFPGATRLVLRFDDRCATEKGSDFVTVYKDDSLAARWGSVQRYSGAGTSGTGWPGANGRAPLQIPAGDCIIHFHADSSITNWGIRVECSAPADATLAHDIFLGGWPSILPHADAARLAELSSHTPLTLLSCQRAVAKACNLRHEALRLLELDARGFSAGITFGAAIDGSDSAHRGWYRDPYDGTTVNLQCAEVYYCDRALTQVPGIISSHPDFKSFILRETLRRVHESVIGAQPDGNAKLCTVASRTLQYTRIQLLRGTELQAASYSVTFWKPLRPDCPALVPEEVPRSELARSSDSSAGASEAVADVVSAETDGTYVSHGWPRPVLLSVSSAHGVGGSDDADRAMWFSGRLYKSRYLRGSLQREGVSGLLDSLIDDAVQRLGLSEEPQLWICDDSPVQPLLVMRLLMWVPPQGDAVVRRGALGLFFDLHVSALPAPHIEVFQVIAHGRTAQRCLVFSSGASRSLRSLPLSAAAADRKDAPPFGAEDSGGTLFGSLPSGRPVVDFDESGWGAPESEDDVDGDTQRDMTEEGLEHEDDVRVAEPGHSVAGLCGLKLNLSRACGVMMTPRVSAASLTVTDDGAAQMSLNGSLTIQRTVFVRRDYNEMTQFTEFAVPFRDVAGLLPECLLLDYELWLRVPTGVIVGYPRSSKVLSHSAEVSPSFISVGTNSLGHAESSLLLVEPLAGCEGTVRISASAARHCPEIADPELWHNVLFQSAAEWTVDACGLGSSARVTLLNLHSAEPSSPLNRLAGVLAAVESLSHVLVWGRVIRRRPCSSQAQITATAVEVVELPRLRTRFTVSLSPLLSAFGAVIDRVPDVPAQHVVRFSCVDHAGLFLTDALLPLNADSRGLPFSLPLENAEGRLFLLTPSFGVRRPRVRTLPFSRKLLPSRTPDWIRCTSSRVLIYPLHPSRRFLAPTSLASLLYLAVLTLFRREYVASAAVLRQCTTDSPLTQEQQWIVSQVRFSSDDCHPDAHAVRCSFALFCFNSCRALAASGFEGPSPTSGATQPAAVISKSAITGRAILPGPSGYGIAGIGGGDLSHRAAAAFRALVDWNVCEDYCQYLKKLSHVSPETALGRLDEKLLVAIVFAEGASAQAHKFAVEDAAGGSSKTAAMSPAALAASATHPSIEVRQRDAFLYGLNEVDRQSAPSVCINITPVGLTLAGHMYRALESCCAEWLEAYKASKWQVRLYYRRPAASLVGRDAVEPITLLWDEPSLLGWSHKTGFGLLYDLLKGDVFVDFFATNLHTPSSPSHVADVRLPQPLLPMLFADSDDLAGAKLSHAALSSPAMTEYAELLASYRHEMRRDSVVLASLLLQGIFLKVSKNQRDPLKLNMYRNWTFFFLAPLSWAALADVQHAAAVCNENAAKVRQFSESVLQWHADLEGWALRTCEWLEMLDDSLDFDEDAAESVARQATVDAPPVRPACPVVPLLSVLHRSLAARFPSLPYAAHEQQLTTTGWMLSEGEGAAWVEQLRAAASDIMTGQNNREPLPPLPMPFGPAPLDPDAVLAYDALEARARQLWDRLLAVHTVSPDNSALVDAASADFPGVLLEAPIEAAHIAMADTHRSLAPPAAATRVACESSSDAWKSATPRIPVTEVQPASRIRVALPEVTLKENLPQLPHAFGTEAWMWERVLGNTSGDSRCNADENASNQTAFAHGTLRASTAREPHGGPLAQSSWGSNTAASARTVVVTSSRLARYAVQPLFPVSDALVAAKAEYENYDFTPLHNGSDVAVAADLLLRLQRLGCVQTGTGKTVAATLSNLLSHEHSRSLPQLSAIVPASTIYALRAALGTQTVHGHSLPTANSSDRLALVLVLQKHADTLVRIRRELLRTIHELECFQRQYDDELVRGLMLDALPHVLSPFINSSTVGASRAAERTESSASAASRDAQLRHLHALMYAVGWKVAPSWEMLASCTLSSRGEDDVRAVLPYLEYALVSPIVFSPVLCEMLACINTCHARRALTALDSLLDSLLHCIKIFSDAHATSDAANACRHIEILSHADRALAVLLHAARSFIRVRQISDSPEPSSVSIESPLWVNGASPPTGQSRVGSLHQTKVDSNVGDLPQNKDCWLLQIDPRPLLVEFLLCSLLRPRQDELCKKMYAALNSGVSGTYQMIMGAGKTTVLSPLLALALADRSTLLLSVVPPPLLHMTVDAFRSVLLSPLLHRPVVQFSFDRTVGLCASAVQPIVVSTGAHSAAPSRRKQRTAAAGKTQRKDAPASVSNVRVSLPWCWIQAHESRVRFMHGALLPLDLQPASGKGWNPVPAPSAFLNEGLAELTFLLSSLLRAAREGWVVCTTPEALKSVFLRYVDLLHAEKNSARLAAALLSRGSSAVPLLSAASDESDDGSSGTRSPAAPPGEIPEEAATTLLRARSFGLAADILSDILVLFRSAGAGNDYFSVGFSSLMSPGSSRDIRTVALLDEADLTFHALKSELNFPVGAKLSLPMSPARWYLPLHLISCVLSAIERVTTSGEPMRVSLSVGEPAIDPVLLARVTQALAEGSASFDVQNAPHLVLVSPAWYQRRLAPVMADVALSWLLATQRVLRADLVSVSASIDHAQLRELPYATEPPLHFSEESAPSSEVAMERQSPSKRARHASSCEISIPATTGLAGAIRSLLCSPAGPDTSAAWQRTSALLEAHLHPESLRMVNMARKVLGALPHCLAKVSRVHYGLLEFRRSDSGGKNTTRRHLTAVPFVGKDVPSAASEFADPETLICLTALAFRHEGLRLADAHSVAAALKKQLLYEQGTFSERPAWRLFHRWLRASADQARGEGKDASVLPLDLFQPEDPAHLQAFWIAVRKQPAVIEHYLVTHVFQVATAAQPAKLSTSGHDLGSSLLLGLRCAFTGTPSELQPTDMGPSVQYEPGAQREVLLTLLSSDHVRISALPQWSVLRVLDYTARCPRQPLHALIDVGGLVTGLSNKAVAAALLTLGISHVDGAVYIDDHNRKKVLIRLDQTLQAPLSASAVPQPSLASLLHSAPFKQQLHSTPVPLARCGIPRERLFVFFDQVHATGTDIAQAVDAVALVTLCKDSTWRDVGQGAYRMRGLGHGQRVEILVVDEVDRLIRTASVASYERLSPVALHRVPAAADAISPVDVAAWLVLNNVRSESVQALALQQQKVALAGREAALALLLRSRLPRPSASAAAPQAPGPTTHNLQLWSRFLERADDVVNVNLAPCRELRERGVPLAAQNAQTLGASHLSDSLFRARVGDPDFHEPGFISSAPAAPEPNLDAGGVFSIHQHALLAMCVDYFVQRVVHEFPADAQPPESLRAQLLRTALDGIRLIQMSGPRSVMRAATTLEALRNVADLSGALTGPVSAGFILDSDASLLKRDSEQVQEQEQEQEQRRETEEERSEAVVLDPVGLTPWPASALLLLPVALAGYGDCDNYPAAHLLGSFATPVVCIFNTLLQAPSELPCGALRGLLVSVNHTRPTPASGMRSLTLPSRLRNASVMLYLEVPVAGAPPVCATVLLSLREAETVRWLLRTVPSHGFDLPPPAGYVTLVAKLFSIYSYEASHQRSPVGVGGSALLQHAQLCVPQDVFASLREGGGDASCRIGVVTSPRQCAIAGATAQEHAAALAAATLRFFDCDLFPSPSQLSELFAATEAWLTPEQRLCVALTLMSRRRRDRTSLLGTPLVAYLSHATQSEWVRFTEAAAGVAEALHPFFPSLKAAFESWQKSVEHQRVVAPIADPYAALPLSSLVEWLCSPPVVAMLATVLADALAATLTGPQEAEGSSRVDRGLGVGSPTAVAAFLRKALVPGVLCRLRLELSSPGSTDAESVEPRLTCAQFVALFSLNTKPPGSQSNTEPPGSQSSAELPLVASSVATVPVKMLLAQPSHTAHSASPLVLIDAESFAAMPEPVMSESAAGTSAACGSLTSTSSRSMYHRALLRAYRRAAAGKLSIHEATDIGLWVPIAVAVAGSPLSTDDSSCLSVTSDTTVCAGDVPLLANPTLFPQSVAAKLLRNSAAQVVPLRQRRLQVTESKDFSVLVPRGIVMQRPTPQPAADTCALTASACYFEVELCEIGEAAAELPLLAIGVTSYVSAVLGNAVKHVMSGFAAPEAPDVVRCGAAPISLGGSAQQDFDTTSAWITLQHRPMREAVVAANELAAECGASSRCLRVSTLMSAVVGTPSPISDVPCSSDMLQQPHLYCGDALGVEVKISVAGDVDIIYCVIAARSLLRPMNLSDAPSSTMAPPVLSRLRLPVRLPLSGSGVVPVVAIRPGLRIRINSGALAEPSSWRIDESLSWQATSPLNVASILLTNDGRPKSAPWLHSVAAAQLEVTTFSAAGDAAGWIQAASGNAGLKIAPPVAIAAATGSAASIVLPPPQHPQQKLLPENAALPPSVQPAAAPSAVAAPQPQMLWRIEGGPTSRFPSVMLSGCMLTEGRFYYEVTVHLPGVGQVRLGVGARHPMTHTAYLCLTFQLRFLRPAPVQVGWADAAFVASSESGQGVGDDKASFAYDGQRLITWHAGSRPWGKPWSAGDVIGCAAYVSGSRAALAFSLNGDFSPPMGLAFVHVSISGGITPALSLQRTEFVSSINLGQGGPGSFRYPPPPGYHPVHDWFASMPRLRSRGQLAALVPWQAPERRDVSSVSGECTAAAKARCWLLPVAGAAHLLVGSTRLLAWTHRTMSPLAIARAAEHGGVMPPVLLSSTAGAVTLQMFGPDSPRQPAALLDLLVMQSGCFSAGFSTCRCATSAPDWSGALGVGVSHEVFCSTAGATASGRGITTDSMNDGVEDSNWNGDGACQLALLHICRASQLSEVSLAALHTPLVSAAAGSGSAEQSLEPDPSEAQQEAAKPVQGAPGRPLVPEASLRGSSVTFADPTEPLGWIVNPPLNSEDARSLQPLRGSSNVAHGEGLFLVATRCCQRGAGAGDCLVAQVGCALPDGGRIRLRLSPSSGTTGGDRLFAERCESAVLPNGSIDSTLTGASQWAPLLLPNWSTFHRAPLVPGESIEPLGANRTAAMQAVALTQNAPTALITVSPSCVLGLPRLE